MEFASLLKHGNLPQYTLSGDSIFQFSQLFETSEDNLLTEKFLEDGESFSQYFEKIILDIPHEILEKNLLEWNNEPNNYAQFGDANLNFMTQEMEENELNNYYEQFEKFDLNLEKEGITDNRLNDNQLNG